MTLLFPLTFHSCVVFSLLHINTLPALALLHCATVSKNLYCWGFYWWNTQTLTKAWLVIVSEPPKFEKDIALQGKNVGHAS